MSTSFRLRQRLRHVPRQIVDLLFPPVCANCNRVGALICTKCQDSISWLAEPLCMRCGRPNQTTVLRCMACRGRPFPLRQMRAAVLFNGPVPRVIHRFKYQGAFALSEPIGEWMAAAWSRWETPVNLIVPIPLHRERERERGYNQSTLLVQQLATRLQQPADWKALVRVRSTRPQATLRAADRQQNVRDAFRADPERIAGKDVLLVDDVYTTGATLREASVALINSGARSVTGYCAAQAVDR